MCNVRRINHFNRHFNRHFNKRAAPQSALRPQRHQRPQMADPYDFLLDDDEPAAPAAPAAVPAPAPAPARAAAPRPPPAGGRKPRKRAQAAQPPKHAGSPSQQPKRRRGGARGGEPSRGAGSPDVEPLPPLDPLGPGGATPEAVQAIEAAEAELAEAWAGITLAQAAHGLPMSHEIRVVTITIDCALRGEPIGDDEIRARLRDADVIAFSEARVGRQPELGSTRFQNAVVLRITDRAPSNNKACNVFHSRPLLHITGCTAVDEFRGVAEYYRGLLQQVARSEYLVSSFKINLINTEFRLGFFVNMTRALELLSGTPPEADVSGVILRPTHDRRVHAAIKLRYPTSSLERAVIMVFRRGSVIILAQSGGAVHDAYRFVTRVFARALEEVRLPEEECYDDAGAHAPDLRDVMREFGL